MIRDIDVPETPERWRLKICDRWCYDMGGDNTSTSSQSSAPWAPAQGYLTDLMGQAKTLYNQGSQYAPFSTVAPFSDQTLQGLNMTQNLANQGSPNVNAASGALTNLLQAQNTPINPYLDQMYNAASKPVINSVNAQFSQAGRTGSTANQDSLTSKLGDVAAGIYGTGYENAANRNLQQNNQKIAGATLAPSLDAARYAPAQNLLTAGNAYDQKANQYIQDALSRWNYGQEQPWNLLKNYAAGVLGGGSQGGTTTGTSTAPTQSPIPQLLGTGVNLLAQDSSKGPGSIFANLLGW